MFLRSGGEAYLICHYGGDARHFAVGCSEHCGVVVFWLLLVSVKGALVVLFRRRAVGCGMQEGGTHLLSGSSVYIGLLDCGRLWPLEDLSELLHPSDSPTMALLWYPRTWRRRPFRRFRLSGFKSRDDIGNSRHPRQQGKPHFSVVSSMVERTANDSLELKILTSGLCID
ncbi:hypothetical protein Bca101_036545 [Brassica carinata]